MALDKLGDGLAHGDVLLIDDLGDGGRGESGGGGGALHLPGLAVEINNGGARFHRLHERAVVGIGGKLPVGIGRGDASTPG